MHDMHEDVQVAFMNVFHQVNLHDENTEWASEYIKLYPDEELFSSTSGSNS